MDSSWGPLTQVAWVVTDIAAAEERLTRSLGVQKWSRMPEIQFGPETCRYRGGPSDHVAHIALGYLGNTQLELIEPVRGESIYREFLDAGGRGVHHFCFEPTDFDAALAELASSGRPEVQGGDMGGAMRFAYVDGDDVGVPFIEFAEVGADMRNLFEMIRTGAL